ncbi:MAG TPA: hypothetical protein VFJ59_14520 [Pseudolabrys sp.]|jgi:hypothetical protein|nr:hypothetical protein [Pseudolabrys sp.]
MDKTVARLNIEHYRRLLVKETDEPRRQMLLRLLAEEEAKIADPRPQKETPLALGLLVPMPPVRRTHIQPLPGFRIHPTAGDASAGKNQRMRAVLVNHGEFKIAFERRARDGLPHFLKCA